MKRYSLRGGESEYDLMRWGLVEDEKGTWVKFEDIDYFLEEYNTLCIFEKEFRTIHDRLKTLISGIDFKRETRL